MTTIFSRIIAGELPGRFVLRNERVVAFLTIEPMTPGHTLVVPVQPVDHWIDLDPALTAEMFVMAQAVGRAIDRVWSPKRVGVMVVGDEVPHVHVHVVGFNAVGEMSFANADRHASPESLDHAAERLREALRAMGVPGVSR